MQRLYATQLHKLQEGDELGGQEKAFQSWAAAVYKVCLTYLWLEKPRVFFRYDDSEQLPCLTHIYMHV